MRVLESKIETALVENQRLNERLATSEAAQNELVAELAKKKAENARLVQGLNEARA